MHYNVKREKCKVNDVIFPSDCEARAINLGNKKMKLGIFTGGTSVRSKNIFTHVSLDILQDSMKEYVGKQHILLFPVFNPFMNNNLYLNIV